ncbi:MAG: hypothetical protein RSD40_02220 [Bacilli bacterium]
MNKLKVKLENCFGIDKLSYEFDFADENVYAIYARNGLMKTSFLKTFSMIQKKNISNIRDEIFDIQGTANITVDGAEIKADDIFVIKSFENSYESDSITSLLLDDRIKIKIKDVLKEKNAFMKEIEKYSGLKIAKTSLGKTIYELESTLVKDFDFLEQSFLLNLEEFNLDSIPQDFSNIKYNALFDISNQKKITSPEFQSYIDDFVTKSMEIYDNYGFLDKGVFTLPKLKNIASSLKNDNFFVKDNYIILNDAKTIKTPDELKNLIETIDNELKITPEFKKIEKLLSDTKGIMLKDIIENNPYIVAYLKNNKLPKLKKNMWLSYIKEEEIKFNELKKSYKDLENDINNVNLDETSWKKALCIFKERFSVPYDMKITNLKSAIIGENIPRVSFSFSKNGKSAEFSRTELESINVLSQGEQRSLYLLNIIFDIEKRRKDNLPTLFIIDDIADSFDYKNKYAIVEYLYDIAHNDNFNLIILSHNFDFHRTISSRLNLNREKRLNAMETDEGLYLFEEKYQNQPFEAWKNNMNEKNVIALIPFVRNIIEYTADQNCNSMHGIDSDISLLTNLLHQTEFTSRITFSTLKLIYKNYLGNDNFCSNIDNNGIVINALFSIAESILPSEVNLENKIILAIAIRQKAEIFMFSEIRAYTGVLSWYKRKQKKVTVTSKKFLEGISRNQTRELFAGYKQFGELKKINLLESVNIMTPENIHLNSFMYEPLLDMDIIELINLYSKVTTNL